MLLLLGAEKGHDLAIVAARAHSIGAHSWSLPFLLVGSLMGNLQRLFCCALLLSCKPGRNNTKYLAVARCIA